jgi:DNA polymerase I
VRRFMEEIVARAGRDGYVTTLLGRRRSLPDIHAKNKSQREFAERTAINTPIQGTAADIMKLAMIACRQVIAAEGLRARMLLQIHDELVFELPPEEMDRATRLITIAMEQVLTLEVPLVVNCVAGKNLAK